MKNCQKLGEFFASPAIALADSAVIGALGDEQVFLGGPRGGGGGLNIIPKFFCFANTISWKKSCLILTPAP